MKFEEGNIPINIKIITDVANNVKKYAPNAFVIVLCNPLDAIVYSFYKVSGFSKNKVIRICPFSPKVYASAKNDEAAIL